MTAEELQFLTRLPREECAAVIAVARELHDARQNHGDFVSAHEGYAVILEELEELWAEVMKKRELRDRGRMAREAIQVAAMGARFALDLCPGEVR
jgi:hypothetical protein